MTRRVVPPTTFRSMGEGGAVAATFLSVLSTMRLGDAASAAGGSGCGATGAGGTFFVAAGFGSLSIFLDFPVMDYELACVSVVVSSVDSFAAGSADSAAGA